MLLWGTVSLFGASKGGKNIPGSPVMSETLYPKLEIVVVLNPYGVSKGRHTERPIDMYTGDLK
jgi:hypothetical protein